MPDIILAIASSQSHNRRLLFVPGHPRSQGDVKCVLVRSEVFRVSIERQREHTGAGSMLEYGTVVISAILVTSSAELELEC